MAFAQLHHCIGHSGRVGTEFSDGLFQYSHAMLTLVTSALAAARKLNQPRSGLAPIDHHLISVDTIALGAAHDPGGPGEEDGQKANHRRVHEVGNRRFRTNHLAGGGIAAWIKVAKCRITGLDWEGL